MKKQFRYIHLFLIILLVGAIHCKQSYNPPAIKNPDSYLVVDGFINTGANGVSSFNLNRTRGLNDTTATGIPELNAKITILGSNGTSYSLTDTAGKGIYTSLPLNLNITQHYSIQITTADGRKYASDPVTCQQTPAIDSVYWRQPGDLTIYVNSHDPTGNIHFYRFDFLETWEHDSEFQSPWTVSNGLIVVIDSGYNRDRCWTTRQSSSVLLANSSALSQDTIPGFALTTIPTSDVRLNIRYSILARQYALTADAYNYWQLVQKTSDNTGSLFDVQPTQLIGNIHCTSNPAEPVIGFLSATSVQQQRIFINHLDLFNWPITDTISGCTKVGVAVNPNNVFIWSYPDTSFGPWYFTTGGPLYLLPNKCMNCLYAGGTNIKPSFWQ